MILVDSSTGSRELLPILTRAPLSLKAELVKLEFADFCFEGNGPNGLIAVGVERKRIGDMLRCIDDGRYNGHQRVGMAQMYQANFLVVEGSWRPHDQTGMLMEQYNGGGWGVSKAGGDRAMYNKLRRYLFSVSLSGVHVLYTRDMIHTAWDVHELFHYFQKKWRDHTSMLQMQKLNIPTLNAKPSLVRRWAADLPGIGVVHSEIVERHFRRPIRLATAEEREWLRIPGIGPKTAHEIIKEILG